MEHGTVGDASIRERMGQAGKGKWASFEEGNVVMWVASTWPVPLAALGAETWSDFWPHPAPDLFSSWDVSLLLLTFTQQPKNKKRTEMEMLYGSAPWTPNKRRGLAPTKPGKVLEVNRTLWGPHGRCGGLRPGLSYSLPSVLQSWGFLRLSGWVPFGSGWSIISLLPLLTLYNM